MKKQLCWDKPCEKGVPICCFDCEAFEGCPEGCNQLECRRKMVDEDEKTQD